MTPTTGHCRQRTIGPTVRVAVPGCKPRGQLLVVCVVGIRLRTDMELYIPLKWLYSSGLNEKRA
jgi:hypothetical protein